MGAKASRRELDGLLAELDAYAALAGDERAYDARVEAVSRWSVGEHVEHCVRADAKILERIHGAADGTFEARPEGRPNWIGRYVLWTGTIPRGRGKAPDFTVPDRLPRAEVGERLAEARAQAEALRPKLAAIAGHPGRWPHPALGVLSPAQWLRFTRIHHRHHRRLIDAIRR